MSDDVNRAGQGLLQQWPDLAGRLKGGAHVLPVRVYHEDTDFSGLVYHASYLRWCERGRSDFVRLIGVDQKTLFEGEHPDGLSFFVVRRMELDYFKPALMDDVLEVWTRVDEIGVASIDLVQEIKRGDVVLFRAQVRIVLVNETGRPARLSVAMKSAFGL